MDKKGLFSKIKQIDSINDKLDNILETQYVEESGQYINARDTLDGYSKGVLIEGNTHQNIYNGDEIKVQPNVEATDTTHYIGRSLDGELDQFSISGKSMKNLATCEREIVVQQGEEVEGRSVTLNTVAGGRVDDIVIKGVSMKNCTTEDLLTGVAQPSINVTGDKISIPDSYEGNLDFSKVVINGKSYNNLLKHEYLGDANVSSDTTTNEYTLTCTNGGFNTFLWHNVFLKDNTVYTVAFTVVSISQMNSYAPSSGDKETGVRVNYASGLGYKKTTFRTNKANAAYWNRKQFTIWYNGIAEGQVVIANPILLEGDFSNVELPNSINGFESVNENGNGIEISSFSQNLVDINTLDTLNGSLNVNIEGNSISLTTKNDSTYNYRTIPLSHLKPNSRYTLTADMIGESDRTLCRIYDFAFETEVGILMTQDDFVSFTTPANVSQLKLVLYAAFDQITPANSTSTYSNIQIVEGETKKSYAPFIKSTKIINSNLPLRSIEDLHDSIEKINGEWYHVQRIKDYKLIKDSSFEYTTAGYSNDESVCIIINNTKLIGRKPSSRASSNLLPKIQNVHLNNHTDSGFNIGNNLDMRVRLDMLGDIDGLTHEQKIDKAMEYLISRNMTVYYELEKPILTKIEAPSIDVYNNFTYITSSDRIRPELSVNTTLGVDTTIAKLKEYSVVFDAENLASTNANVNINLEVDNVEYSVAHAFTNDDIGRYVVRIISENPNPRINFVTPGFKITNVMVFEGYDDEYYQLDYISGLKSVDKNLDISICGANIINYMNPEYFEKTDLFSLDSNGYIAGTLLRDDNWTRFNCFKDTSLRRIQPDKDYSVLIDIAESALSPLDSETRNIVKFGNGHSQKFKRTQLKDAYYYDSFDPGIKCDLYRTFSKECFKSSEYAIRTEFTPNTSGDVKFRYMLAEGDLSNKNLAYQPFNEIRRTIQLNDYLRSLPNGIRDTIEKIGDKWYHVKRVGKRVLSNATDENWMVSYNYGDRFRIRTTDGIIQNDFKFDSERVNFFIKGYTGSLNPDDVAFTASITGGGKVQLMLPKNDLYVDSQTALNLVTAELSSNPIILLYELKNYIMTEINMPEIETMDTHTHIYSYSNLRPIIKASTISRAKMSSMKPNTTYTLLCTANVYTSTSNILNIEYDGVPYSFNLGEGDNFIKHTFTTNNNLNTKDIVFKTIGMKISDVIIIEGDYNNPIKPNYFRNIMSVGEENNVLSMKIIGANIFKATPYNRGNALFNIIDDNNVKVWYNGSSKYIYKYFVLNDVKPNTKYSLNADVRVISGTGRIRVVECGMTDGKSYTVGKESPVISSNSNIKMEFTTSDRISNDRVLTIAVYCSQVEPSNGEVYYENISLREYEDIYYTYDIYRESLTNIELIEPLRSLPDGTKDTIEQKEDGSWVVKRHITKKSLSEATSIVPEELEDRCRLRVRMNGVKPKTAKNIHVLCDKIDAIDGNTLWNTNIRSISVNNYGDIHINLPYNELECGLDNWILMNNPVIYYEQEEIIEEPLPELNKLPLYDYGTHITTNNVVLPELYIKNECIIDLPLLQANKEYTFIMDINSAYSNSNGVTRIYTGSSFTEINRKGTRDAGYAEYLRYYTTLTSSVNGFIKIDDPGSKIQNLQIIIGNKIDEHLNGNIPFGLNSVGENGVLKIKSIGKNLFSPRMNKYSDKVNVEIVNENEFIITNLSEDKWCAARFKGIEFERDVQYTISYDYEILQGVEETTISVRDSDSNSNHALILKTVSGSKGSLIVTFVPRLQKHQIEIFIAKNAPNINGKIKIINFQIEKGTERTSHKSYNENISTIILENGPLRKLPNGIRDTIEVINGVSTIVRRIGETTYDGSSDESWRINDVNDVRTQFTLGTGDNPISVPVLRNGNILCDTMVVENDNNIADVCWIYDGCIVAVQKDKNTFDTKEKLISWLQENPLTINYELPEYRYEPIQDAILNLKSYKDFTHISGHETLVYPNLTFKFAANLGAVIQASSDRITAIVNKIEKLNEISYTNLMNIVSLQEQLDNHIKKI